MRFFDQALEDFKTALARDGLLDDTVLVVFGDHDAGFPRESADAGAGDRHRRRHRVGARRSRPVLRAGARSAHAHLVTGARSHAAGQTDFAPTLLALLGIDPAPLPYLGRNLLGGPDDPPIVRPYGDWLDSTHLFLSRGVNDGGRNCYALASPAVTSRTRVATPTRLRGKRATSRVSSSPRISSRTSVTTARPERVELADVMVAYATMPPVP